MGDQNTGPRGRAVRSGDQNADAGREGSIEDMNFSRGAGRGALIPHRGGGSMAGTGREAPRRPPPPPPGNPAWAAP